MTPRENLPARRIADAATFEHCGRRGAATASRFADGGLAEILLTREISVDTSGVPRRWS